MDIGQAAKAAGGNLRLRRVYKIDRSVLSFGLNASESFSLVVPHSGGGTFTLRDAAYRSTPPIPASAGAAEIQLAVERLFSWAECTAARDGTIAGASPDSFEPSGVGAMDVSAGEGLNGWSGAALIDPSTAFCGRGSLRVSAKSALPGYNKLTPTRTWATPRGTTLNGRTYHLRTRFHRIREQTLFSVSRCRR